MRVETGEYEARHGKAPRGRKEEMEAKPSPWLALAASLIIPERITPCHHPADQVNDDGLCCDCGACAACNIHGPHTPHFTPDYLRATAGK